MQRSPVLQRNLRIGWKSILLLASCFSLNGCNQEGIRSEDEIQLLKPSSCFSHSNFFRVLYFVPYAEQYKFETTFAKDRTRYVVRCEKGVSRRVTIYPPRKTTFSREGALALATLVLPGNCRKMVYRDAEDLEKRDAKRLCEHLTFQENLSVDFQYADNSTTKVAKIDVCSPREPMQ